jgi:hypothetical protein
MERSEEFGQTSSQMSEIAREARGLAEKWVTRHLNKSIFCAILCHFLHYSLIINVHTLYRLHIFSFRLYMNDSQANERKPLDLLQRNKKVLLI